MIGDNPVRGLVSRDNSLLYVANHALAGGHRLLDRRRQAHRLDPRRRRARGAGVFRRRALLFVADSRSGDVAVVRTPSQSLFTLLPAGRDPNAIVDKAFNMQ